MSNIQAINNILLSPICRNNQTEFTSTSYCLWFIGSLFLLVHHVSVSSIYALIPNFQSISQDCYKQASSVCDRVRVGVAMLKSDRKPITPHRHLKCEYANWKQPNRNDTGSFCISFLCKITSFQFRCGSTVTDIFSSSHLMFFVVLGQLFDNFCSIRLCSVKFPVNF